MRHLRPALPPTERKRSRRVPISLVGTAVAAAALVVFSAPAWASGFGATLRSGSTGFSSGTIQLRAVTGSSACYSTGSGSAGTVPTNAASCTGNPEGSGTLSTSPEAASVTLTSQGRNNASAAAMASVGCGVADLVDSAGADTALPFAGLTYQAPGPLGTEAVALDGSTGWAETTQSYANPEGFTVLAWIQTSSPGAILGFSNQVNPTTSAPTSHDRQLWIDSFGRLVWGVSPSSKIELTSPSAIDTGNWVFAAASVGPSGTSLYVNGARVALSSSTTSAQSYTGWWSLGYAYLSGWSDTPNADYLNGSLAQVAVIPSPLSSSQILGLYGDSTVTAYTTAVDALSPTNYWALNDSGAVPYEGAIPSATTSTVLVDSSGNANTGTAETGVTLGAAGPASAVAGVSLNGSSGYVQTAKSYTDPEVFSIVTWFRTATSGATTGGTVIAFSNQKGTITPALSDRLVWLDNAGHLVWGVYDGARD